MAISLTYNEAMSNILTLVKETWETTGYVLVYPNNKNDGEPPTADAWARVDFKNLEGGQSGFGGSTNKFTREGLLSIQIFTLSGKPLSFRGDLIKLLQDAFENTNAAPGVWFRNAKPDEIGPSGKWYQVNFLVEYIYNEVK